MVLACKRYSYKKGLFLTVLKLIPDTIFLVCFVKFAIAYWDRLIIVKVP